MKDTVLSKISHHCIRARKAELPLIMLDTTDVELALEVGLKCGVVLPLKQNRGVEARYAPYQVFVRDGMSQRYEDYTNMFSSWDSLLAEDAVLTEMKPGMYVLKLDKTIWYQNEGEQDSRVNWLRQYVQAYVAEYDWHSPVRASCILLYGNVSLLPEDLMNYTEIIEEPYPNTEEIEQTLLETVKAAQIPLTDPDVIREITTELMGFSRQKLRTLLRGMINGGKLLDPKLRKEEILDVKKQFLLQTGDLLKLEVLKEERRELGGMAAYKEWVSGRKATPEERRKGEKDIPGIKARLAEPEKFTLERGIPPLKGVLLVGVPGCGKSEAAKVLHQEMNPKAEPQTNQKAPGLPMVRLSISRLMGGVVGESERRMRTALKQAEAMAPCIVFIDELDKGFSGASSKSNSDSGVFKRMFGDLLTWMQENDKGCFIFATANDISQLPPEFFRSGRFDALYSVFLPTKQECISIFRVHMKLAQERMADKAKAMGRKPGPPLFQGIEKGCGSDTVLEEIMTYFVYDKVKHKRENIKFVSGADIEKIVITALGQVELVEDPNGKITVGNWKNALKAVIDSPNLNTQGGSVTGLNSIAECYLRLLRGNFIPVSGEKELLLKKDGYKVFEQDGKITAKYEGKEPTNDYDRELYLALVQRINRMAPNLENMESMYSS